MITRCISLSDKDIFFNLAAEEYLLKNSENDIFMIWQSHDAVVVGRHQNVLAEINHHFANQNNIKIARRISGGGTVFHDCGNLNFTFIRENQNLELFTKQMIFVLTKSGLRPEQDKHHAIFLDRLKISGCAHHIYKGKVLHHGTLLFNSNLNFLKEALNVDSGRCNDKSVQSNRSKVANIADYLPELTITGFSEFIFRESISCFSNPEIKNLSEQEVSDIEKLKKEKYSTWEWVYGCSPKYQYNNTLSAPPKTISFSLWVEKGRIVSSEWNGLSIKVSALLSKKLYNQKHEYNTLKQLLQDISDHLAKENINSINFLEKLI